MKRIITIIFVLSFFLLTGCDFYQPNMQSLLRPPVISALQSEVEKALQDTVGDDYHLTYPTEGSNMSPFVFVDIDNDGAEESVVFYSPDSDHSFSYIQTLARQEDKWYGETAIPGHGSQVLFVSIIPVFQQDSNAVVVGWKDEDTEVKNCSVYYYGEYGLTEIFSASYEQIAITDFNNDRLNELLIAQIDDTMILQYIGVENGTLKVLDSRELPVHFLDLSEPVTGPVSSTLNGTVLYGHDSESSLLSVLIAIDRDTIVIPQEMKDSSLRFFSNYSNAVPMILDSTGTLALPVSTSVPPTERNTQEPVLYFTEYWTLSGDSFVCSMVSFYNDSDGWIFTIPDIWLPIYKNNHLTVERHPETRECIFSETFFFIQGVSNGELLRIQVINQSEWTSSSGNQFIVAEKGSYIYNITVPADSALIHENIQAEFRLLNA